MKLLLGTVRIRDPAQCATTGDSTAGLSCIPSFHSTSNVKEYESPLKMEEGEFGSAAAHRSPTMRIEVVNDSGYSVTTWPPLLYSG